MSLEYRKNKVKLAIENLFTDTKKVNDLSFTDVDKVNLYLTEINKILKSPKTIK